MVLMSMARRTLHYKKRHRTCAPRARRMAHAHGQPHTKAASSVKLAFISGVVMVWQMLGGTADRDCSTRGLTDLV